MAQTSSLPAELTIYTVGECYPTALQWISPDDTDSAADDALRVDASGVEEVDGAGIQLLMALFNSLARQGRSLVLVDPAAPLVAACSSLGTNFLLGADAQGAKA